METIRGKASLDLHVNELADRLANYKRIILDLGTGDGRYVHFLAKKNPHHFIIGVDSCRENLREHSRAKPSNMLFVIASAQNLPSELNGLVSHITINFPWGSLLQSLLDGDSRLMRGLESIAGLTISVDIRLNGGALAEAGYWLEAGTEKIYNNLVYTGWHINKPRFIDGHALRAFPTTWARRLACGRDPRAMAISGCIK